MLPRPAKPSFVQDIMPLFQRMSQLEWVNAGFAAGFGFGGVFNFSTPEWLQKLSDPTPANMEQRRVICNQFRRFEVDGVSPAPWPWLYGDAMNSAPPYTARQYTELTQTQLTFLQQWVNGEFIADYPPSPPPRNIDQVNIAAQPDMLTRAAMEFCLADAFHPGCEMTWPMRKSGMYSAPYRLGHAPKGWQEPNFGPQLNSDVLTLPSGPILGGQLPGTITRWMAIPWQTDTASCRSGYYKTYDPYLPTFWPARVPNQVMSQAQYRVVGDTSLEMGQRLQAFANRANWFEPLGLSKSYTEQINHMIHHFDEMGVVEVRVDTSLAPAFPAVMQVEDKKPHQHGSKLHHAGLHHGKSDAETDLSAIEKVNRFKRT
jgi:hypothetical protein